MNILSLMQVLFSYEELLNYFRTAKKDDKILERIALIPDSGTRDMVTHMIAINPRDRLRAGACVCVLCLCQSSLPVFFFAS